MRSWQILTGPEQIRTHVRIDRPFAAGRSTHGRIVASYVVAGSTLGWTFRICRKLSRRTTLMRILRSRRTSLSHPSLLPIRPRRIQAGFPTACERPARAQQNRCQCGVRLCAASRDGSPALSPVWRCVRESRDGFPTVIYPRTPRRSHDRGRSSGPRESAVEMVCSG